MLDNIYKETEDKMKKAAEAFKKEIAGIRTGRATPALLDKVKVEYYGSLMPISQVAHISIPDPKTVEVAPWDKGIIHEVEKAILKADIGLTPVTNGSLVRISIPPLTGERRQELTKLVKKQGEDIKVSVRNARRDAIEKVKQEEKDKKVSEDQSRKAQDHIQKLTDKYTKEIDDLVKHKEKEISEI